LAKEKITSQTILAAFLPRFGLAMAFTLRNLRSIVLIPLSDTFKAATLRWNHFWDTITDLGAHISRLGAAIDLL
jgi:hypothetical protein